MFDLDVENFDFKNFSLCYDIFVHYSEKLFVFALSN